MQIPDKTLNDLEFGTILALIQEYTTNNLSASKIKELVPLDNFKRLQAELHFVEEILQSFSRPNPFPSIDFDDIRQELKLLTIDESFLEAHACLKILKLCTTTFIAIKYIAEAEESFPYLVKIANKVTVNKQIVKKIQQIFNRFGEIKDDATPELAEIRSTILTHSKLISDQFRNELKKYGQQDFLDSIQESVIDEKRVLAVKAAYRKRVDGSVLGQSKSGSIVFMEPNSMVKLNRALLNLKEDERQEIITILKKLTNLLREDIELLAQYQAILTHLDFVRAKAKFAETIHACLPKLVSKPCFDLHDAYHPLLLVRNSKKGEKTIPQTIALHENNRIISISGPNAGGKSISLKTVGLLQLMIQSGILIPVQSTSTVGYFEQIITDIGDNQSIENHLSTYSYRLKQMRDFLKKSNASTLFLIDEFGTGSDPELGGALAEVFIEELYEKGSFGILTTHYTNIKLVIEELPNAINACMLFDEKTLEPLYKLEVGQAGSSFTFEVAQKNGIPFSLINRAKKKIEKNTVRLDKTMVKLQQEKFKIEKSKQKIESMTDSIMASKEKLQTVNEKVEYKLLQYQDAFDRNQKYINLGKKIDQLADKYLHSKQKKDLLREVFKIVEMENAKKIILPKKEYKQSVAKEKQIDHELTQKIEKIREKRATNEAFEKELQEKELAKKIQNFTVGMRVKVAEGVSVGTIEKIEKEHAFINFGIATLKAKLKDLNLVR